MLNDNWVKIICWINKTFKLRLCLGIDQGVKPEELVIRVIEIIISQF